MIDTDQERYIQEQLKEKQELKQQEEKIKQLYDQYQKIIQENQQLHDKIQELKGTNYKFSGMVTKQSHTGILSHKRLLVLAHNHLSYYSKIPHGFNEQKPEDIIEPAKSSVHIYNIQRCYPQGTNKFVVEFQSMHKQHKVRVSLENQPNNQQSQLRSNIINPKSTKMSKWIFTCPNEEAKKKWDAMINRAKEPPQFQNQEEEYKKQKEKEEKMRQNLEKQKEQELELKQQQERRRMEKEQERRRQEEEMNMRSEQEQIQKMIREEEEERQRKELEAIKKLEEDERKEQERIRSLELQEKEKQLQELLHQKALEEELIRKRKQEALRREGRIEEINKQWTYKYLQAIEVNCIQNKGQQEEDIQIKGRFMYGVINDFKNKVLEFSKILINEQIVGVDSQIYQPIPESLYEQYFTSHPHIDNQYFKVYYQDNIAYKLAFSTMKESFITNNNNQNDQESNTESVYVYYEEAIKHLVHEFKSLNEINNVILQELQKDSYFSLRVPLSCLIEYKGIVILALSMPNIDPDLKQSQTLLKGYNNDDEYINHINKINDHKLITDLNKIAKRLNLKSHLLNEVDEVELCSTIQIHKLLNNDYEDLMLCENIENIEEFAPQYLDIYFLLKCGNLFPLDVNIDSEMTHPHYKIRPEYLSQYQTSLNSDAFVTESNQEEDELEISNATTFLTNQHIPSFIQSLENLDILPLDSHSLTQAFHENGINMRYLGQVCKKTNISHVKEICQTEMVARISKKILRNNIYDSIKEQQSGVGKEERSQLFNQSINKSRYFSNNSRLSQKYNNSNVLEMQKELKNQFATNIDSIIHDNLVDFLNLLLGSGQETEFFWQSIINKQALHDYGCEIDKQDIIKGGLLHALKYHCKIEFIFDQDTGIFESINPIRKEQVIGFVPRYKIYDMKQLLINIQGSQYTSQMKAGQNEMALQSINLKLTILSWLKNNPQQQSLLQQYPSYQDQILQNNQQQSYLYQQQSQSQSQIYQHQSQMYQQSQSSQMYQNQMNQMSNSKNQKINSQIGQILEQGYNNQEDYNLIQEEIKLLSDQSELLLNFYNYEESTIKAVQALDLSPIAHVCQVKSLGNILRTKLMKNDNQKAMECFDRAVQIIEFHLGPFHPLHTILYSLLGYFYSQKRYYEEAIALYRSSLINSKKSLGEYHSHTAEVYKDIGVLYMKMGMADESFANFQMAYKIYVTCNKVQTLPFAEVCSHLATLCLTQSKFEECQNYCIKSIKIYEIYCDQNLKKLIDCHLILCRVQEIIREHEKCLENADMIWNLSSGLDRSEQSTVYEAIIKIILQVFISNMQLEKVNLLYALTQSIDDSIQDEKNGVNLVGFEIQLYNQGLNYIIDQINLGVYQSIESFVKSTLSIISKNIEYLYSVSFFDNYKENIFQLDNLNLKTAIENYENIQMFVSNNFMVDILKRY